MEVVADIHHTVAVAAEEVDTAAAVADRLLQSLFSSATPDSEPSRRTYIDLAAVAVHHTLAVAAAEEEVDHIAAAEEHRTAEEGERHLQVE